MTSLYAILDENIVVSTQLMTEEQCADQSLRHQMVLSVGGLLIPPQVGWILSGNVLVPPPGQEVNLKDMVKAKIKLFQESAPELLRDMYATNTLLGITTQQSDQMFEDYMDILIRIREGGWPTALYRLNQKVPSGFVTQGMIDAWKAMLIARMS